MTTYLAPFKTNPFSTLAMPVLAVLLLTLAPRLAFCQTSVAAPGSPQAVRVPVTQTLPLFDPQNQRRVIGISCDNGPAVPPEQRSSVFIPLPPDVEMPEDAQNPLGSLEFDKSAHGLRYFPPLEFNWQHERDAGGRFALTNLPYRPVTVHVSSVKTDGSLFFGRAPVILIRPTVVLVHGINNDAVQWEGERGRIGMGRALREWNFATAVVSHGTNDLKQRRKNSGATYFKGNGPVELAASLIDLEITRALEGASNAGFVNRRVDLVAHSYGGVAARWYLHNSLPRLLAPADDSLGWYLPAGFKKKKRYVLSSQVAQQVRNWQNNAGPHRVRKLITIASPWRGTPAANFVNELHSEPASPQTDLSRVRLRWGRLPLINIRQFQKLNDKLLSRFLATDVPAMEVMGVESRWLQTLNADPFRDDIAYAAIAASDNAYIATHAPGLLSLSHIDPFTTLTTLLPSDTLPVLQLERLKKRRTNVSDGIVPLWSAVIAEKSPILRAAHNALLWDESAKTEVAQALSSTDLQSGRTLKPIWQRGWSLKFEVPAERSAPPEKRVWHFLPPILAPNSPNSAMAPTDRAAAYQLRDGVARFSPHAIHAMPTPLPTPIP